MGRMTCTVPQCLHKGALYLHRYLLLSLLLLTFFPIFLINFCVLLSALTWSIYVFCFLHLPWYFFLLSPPASYTKNWAFRCVFPDSEVSVISLFTAVSCLLRAFVYVILRILLYCSLLRGAQYEIYIKKQGNVICQITLRFLSWAGKNSKQ